MTHRNQRGFTAIELVVTVLLFSIVLIMMLNFLDSTSQLSSRATLHAQAERDAKVAMRVISQDLRAANPITSGVCSAGGTTYRDCITFEIQRAAQFGRSCEKTVVSYALVGTAVRRSLTENSWSASAGACVVTRSISGLTLLSPVLNTSVSPVKSFLTYYDNKGIVLNPATAADLAKIPLKPANGGTASIKVSVLKRYKPGAPNLDLVSVVSLRNNR